MSEEGQPPYKSSSVYNELRLEGQFCDAIIKVEDVEFPVHRIILCNCTPYFRALFTHCSNPDKQVFNIPGLSPEMMALIIDFAYTGSVSITGENVVELLMAADQLNAMDIVKLCSDFLGEQLCPENCVGIWQFTKICLSPELRAKAYHYIINNFEKVVLEEEFLQLTVEELADIFDREDLNVQLETTVYEALTKWISHVPAEREQHLTALLSKVRLGVMTADYLTDNVLSSELVEANSECMSMIRNAIFDIHDLGSRPFMSGLCHPLARPRLPHSILLAIGGWSGGDPTNGIEAYDYRANRWVNVTNLNNQIYICGGFNGNECLQTAEYYNPESNQWTIISPMNSRRSGIGVIAYADHVFAVGGFDGNNRLRTAEAYNPHTNTWNLVSSMLTPRSNFGIEVIDDRLFAVGGFNGFTTTLNVEYYDALTNEWYEACDMEIFRSALSCCVVSGLSNLTEYTFPRDFLPLANVPEEAMESAEST
ncbi:kelch-like protein 10 [Neolamprologus brichardi]|uniref:kelch-like protein 10 n=1 Tax=Neolamprologus brichardi TaxID=32507 RepID=UPI0003EC1865|nr:kelch-like protein 10 [Neolamprologus brichardi]